MTGQSSDLGTGGAPSKIPRTTRLQTPPDPARSSRLGQPGWRVPVLCVLLLLSGCSFFESVPQARGNRVDADTLKELTPGTSTRADASALLGSPTAKATFDDNQWIYIGAMTRPQIGRTQVVLSQDVVLLTFNDQGVLRDVKQLNKGDALPVTMVARATPSPGSDASILQQLLGNVGRFTPGGLGAGAGAVGSSGSTPEGGAPSGGNRTGTY
jgi:outer membrane protein assembly factor BamE (lipoprotein component of BamABCDE complex)